MNTKNKLKKAVKRIAAFGLGTLLMGSTVYASYDLGNYPDMFVKDGKFSGQVVVGTAADTIDSVAATSIIDDLKAEFSGEKEKVKVTYKKAEVSGEKVNAIKSNSQLNYGEYIQNNTEANGYEDSDISFLADVAFDNGLSDEEYEQKIIITKGLFNYALRDNIEDEIAEGIYYESDDSFAIYQMDFKTAINLNGSSASYTTAMLDDDMIGRELIIMGNEFTIADIDRETDGDLGKIILIGGSDKITLSEDEGAITKIINGKSYEIEILSVSDDKVLLSVNGETKSVDEYDTEDIAGISIAVTDLASSSRDAKAGYAEVVVGGQKITLEDGNTLVKINDENIDDIYEDYEVYSEFSEGSGGWDLINITYKVAEDTLLQKDDYLKDVLFDAFRIEFAGTNEPTIATLELNVNDDNININGVTDNGAAFNREFVYTNSTSGTDGITYLRGNNDDDRIFFKNSANLGVWSATTGKNTILFNNTAGTVTFNFSKNDIKGSGIYLYNDLESQFLYEIASTNNNDETVDVDEVIDDKDKTELTAAKFLNSLEKTLTNSVAYGGNDGVSVKLTDLGDAILAFDNELLMNFSKAENASGIGITLSFSLDSNDVDVDTPNTDDAENYAVTTSWDSSDKEFNLILASDTDFVNSNDANVVDGSTDVKEYVTVYGTKIKYDNDENTYIKIMTPSEQISGNVNLVFGGVPASESSLIVTADKLEEKKLSLEENGYTIVKTESVESEIVEFDVTAVSYDSDVFAAQDVIVVGGPAINTMAADLLGVAFPTYGVDSGVNIDEAVIKYYADKNAVLVYGYEAKDTQAAVNKLNDGGLDGEIVNIQ